MRRSGHGVLPRSDRPANLKSGLRRACEALLLVGIAGYLVYFIYEQRHTVARSWQLEARHFILISAFTGGSWLCSSCILSLALGRFSVRLPFIELIGLHVAAGLLNYLPLRAGTLYRARYLKSRCGLFYTHFASFFALNSLVMIASAAAVGAVAVALAVGLRTTSAVALFAVLVLIAGCSAVPLFVALPRRNSRRRVFEIWNQFADGRTALLRGNTLLPLLLVLHVASALCGAGRLLASYQALGLEVPFAACVLLATVSILVLFISVTPAGIGMVEFLVGAAATLTATAFAPAVIAVTLTRAVAILWSVLIGPLFLVWHRSSQGAAGRPVTPAS